ncbi:discoidin domain-containing protein, partial [Paenibacillus sp. KQZ6P-2]|nr:discoidin domain-containing protein [Paenibacillus mangrovi]
MRKKIKQVFTFLLASAIVVPSFSLDTKTAEAARTSGTAPYINQWAVTGPFTKEQPIGNVDPVIGESIIDQSNSETSIWQYFDDRIFNRNYDDYNDLMGYFDVKQGQNTTDKWVVAATYVYSPKVQTVQWQVGGSGVYKLFAGDTLSGQQTSAASRVNKNGTKYPIALKQGWNKLLIEMQHKNPGTNKNFLGFYTRLSDNNGNEISGLTYSVTGPNVTNNQLKIVTQGLTVDKDAFIARNANVPANDYPSNTLPYAYDENPYVWMVGKIDGKENTSSVAPQASPFTFQATGGNPGYTWGIVDGALPPGLTLAEDGHIAGMVADGAHGTSQKDYKFAVKVTDAQGSTATQQYTITVKKNPVDWFIQGKMSALSHTTGTMPNLYDPNFNYDEWAQTAKEMGMTMLSTESLQNTVYYWPSPNANLTPSDSNKLYKFGALYQSEDGKWQVKDRVMQAKQAAERYGLKFGVYVSSLYEGKEILESDIQGLVERYDPWYVFADGGPESYSNVDVAWSSARNYNDRVLIDANPNAQTGDQDITLHERPFWHSEPYNEGGWRNGILTQTRKVAHEEWNDPYTTALDVWTIYAKGNERDHWPEATKEIINQYGHGYVMNYDSSITVTRGMDNLSSNLDNNNIFAMVPISSQQLSDMRTSIVKWMANAGGPDLRESLYGTMPYTMDCTIKPGWYTDPQMAIAHGQGPDWGYAMSRDQYVYMHMIKNLISGTSKTGFTGQASMSGIGPFNDPIKRIEWLNKGVSLPFTTQQSGGKYYITIDTSSVVADPIDTILKITTEDPARNFAMTSVKLFSSQTSTDKLQLRAECYMNDFTNVFAPATLSYTSDKTSVATVDAATGLVTAVGDGTATITATATYNDGVNAPQVKTDTYPVKVSGGAISAALPLVGVNMFTDGNLFWGQFSTNKDIPVTFQGFTQKGGAVDILGGTNIKYHYATVDGNRNNPTGKIVVTEVPADQVPFAVNGNMMNFTNTVTNSTMYCYWADITVDGKTYTTTRNYITIIQDVNVAAGITPTVTSDSSNAGKLSDGIINDSTGGNRTKWSAPASDQNPSITYDLGKMHDLSRVNVFFNNHMPNADNVTYYNVPNKVKIEYSVDGVNWIAGHETSKLSGGGLPTSRDTLAVPKSDTTLYAWEQEGLYYNYPVDPSKPSVQARYVRISFPGGGQGGSPIDVLEAQVFSSGDLTALANLKLDPKIGADNKAVTVDVKGYSFLGDPLDLTNAKITMISENPSVAAVGADGVITAGSQGKARIQVTASLNGYSASDFFYVDVDANGIMHLNPYLREVKLSLSSNTIKKNEPIVGALTGTLNTGEQADLSAATVEYVFGDPRLEAVPGSNTIVLKDAVTQPFQSTVKGRVTLDGLTMDTNEATITALSGNIASIANVSVSSVRDRNGDPNGNNQDDRYLGVKATDRNKSTSWAAKKADRTPWIKLQFSEPIQIGRINLVDRGHDVNQIVEGLLEWEGGSRKVENIKWNGQPDNIVTFETPITTSWIKFTIDPDNKYNNPTDAECGLAEFEVYEAQKMEKTIVEYKTVPVIDTNLGQFPTLPEQVDAVYNDGTTGQVDVKWEEITPEMVAKEGVFSVYGSVEGTVLKAKATYRVKLVDKQAPTTSDNAPEGWVNQDVTVLLDATDSGTGVASTHYIVNDGEEQTGNSVVFTEEGVHTLVYWSKDKAGNVEERHTVTVKIDKTGPNLTVQLDPVTLWPANHKMVKVNATLDVSDSLSGIASVVLTSITSNEPESEEGDIQARIGSEDTSFSLRAERSGEGTG